ncbi:MAG: 23S rRNA (uracil(1939)-C(5))-methyltransferase RlmD [Verrucomicrobiota bacterium]|nr:23S rRNA (uracil(1939)-C(5))-methyltransferase RlmD [Verrucomicrobiota bacterium]
MEPTLELQIEKFSLKGYGLVRLQRIAPLPPLEVEVAHTLPGDRVQVEMRKKVRGTRKGRLLEVLEASPARVEPACKHARVCGGCCWQQMSYEAQLREKEERVRKTFGPAVAVSPIVPAESIFRYRNKMEFSFSENRGGMRYLGLMIAQAEPYVFNVEECHLCSTWFSDVLNRVRTWWEGSGLKAYDPPRDEGTLRYLTLREAFRTGQKMAVLNVSGNPTFAPSREQLDGFVAAVRSVLPPEEPISLFLRIHQTKKGRPTHFYEMHLGGPDHIVEELHLQGGKLSFKISPSSFFQPNTAQAEKLYNLALETIRSLQPSVVYDLYCGTGTLGMAASRFARQVVGIEISPEALLDAEQNLKGNGLQNCTFHQGDVGQVLTRLLAQPSFQRPDVVIVDPPRAGLDPLALRHLQTLSPKAILYISCNPLTQAENIRELTQAGYQLLSLQPLDQFPHTYHIENIALLARKR